MLRPVPDGDDASANDRKCPLGVCDGSGWVVDDGTNTARPCDCRDERIRRAAGANVGTGIGRRFLEVSYERQPIASLPAPIVRHVRAFARDIGTHLDAGRGLWFDGPVGTGKTSLAILVAKAARDAGRSYAVYPVPRLLAEIKRTFDRDASDSYMQFFRRVCGVDLLVLDDLGAEKQTEWVLEQLYSIVNERWQDERSIVVTTNVPEPDPAAPLTALRRLAVEARAELEELRASREAASGGRVDAAAERLATTAELLSGQVDRLERLDLANDADPVNRLRQQVGARTVSRLVEICDDPIPIMGPDLRMTAQGA